MSRYTIREEPSVIVVGWDPPLGTFFAHEYDSDDDCVWVREERDLERLKSVLDKTGIVIPPNVQDCLAEDEAAKWEPGPLQKRLGFLGKDRR